MVTQAKERRRRVAPYVPASALSEFFDHIRPVREPDIVDSGLLQDYGQSKPNALALLSTLKFLGITDGKGQPTPVFRELQTGGDEFKNALKDVVERAYADLFARLDVAKDTKDKIVNFFARNYSPATAERATRLFLDICGEAGIVTASQPRKADSDKRATRVKPVPRKSQIQKQYPTSAPINEAEESFDDVDGVEQKTSPMRSVQLPLSATEWATLSAHFPLTDDGWNQMIVVLNAMKPALVREKCEREGETRRAVLMPDQGRKTNSLTQEARELLENVDAGGIPAFPTSHLEKIARENHIPFTAQTPPSEVIDALRAS